MTFSHADLAGFAVERNQPPVERAKEQLVRPTAATPRLTVSQQALTAVSTWHLGIIFHTMSVAGDSVKRLHFAP